jgi:hypothetical protein
MKRLFFTLLLATFCAATGYGQTLKALMYNTTNGAVAYAGTNSLTFTNDIVFQQQFNANIVTFEEIFAGQIEVSGTEDTNQSVSFSGNGLQFFNGQGISFTGTNAAVAAATTRTNLALGATNSVTFNRVVAGATNVPQNLIGGFVAQNGSGEEFHINSGGFTFYQGTNTGGSLEAEGRIFSGGVWTFENGASTRGNIVITNQSAATNGLLFVYRTNNEPFLGLANLVASNNTTLSNETLFRVGVAEATNKSAQFGFRTVRTNNGGEGFAVFSVFGYNALMMIGPSDRSRTNTATNAGIEADIWTITPTNRVATLRDTNSGAFTLHQELGFSTNNLNTNAPATNNTVALWLRVWIGTNSYRLPLYQ